MYGRRKKTNRRPVKSARRFGKAPDKAAVARIAKTVFNRQVETKETRYGFGSVAGISFASVGYGASTCITGLYGAINPGATQAQRVGNYITARGIRLHFAIQAGDSYNNIRFLLVSPKQGTPVQPNSITNFALSVFSNQGASATQWCNPVDTNRWNVHMDKSFYLQYVPVDGSTANVIPRTLFLKQFVKLNKKIFWDDVGTINNDVYLVAISDSNVVPNPGVVAGFVNCYFKDA